MNDSYKALARKWRPKNFDQFVGQSHVVQTLKNSLDNHRLHHAYLFSGTRGVGKTTLARILAKCLSCEKGISSSPCDTCLTCTEINEGLYLDLLEIDAASRTKVEDTRELLENIPYAPSRGKYKIYLIDEIHMLSKHSFNALLKTLEEPPKHIKFLFATTEIDKLPSTILSRCIHFRLKFLTSSLISNQLENILQKERIQYDQQAIKQISFAADGSLRDALSILEQAISFGNGQVIYSDVCQLLGTIDKQHIIELLDSILKQDAAKAILKIKSLAEISIDFNQILTELINLIHQVALLQVSDTLIPPDTSNIDLLKSFSKAASKEELQLIYQIALIGQRDLPLLSNLQAGLEMVILRMIYFQPEDIQPMNPTELKIKNKTNNNIKLEFENTSSSYQENKELSLNPSSETILSKNSLTSLIPWADSLDKLNLGGVTYLVASHCILEESSNYNTIQLILDLDKAHFLNDKIEQRIKQALGKYLMLPVGLTIKIGKSISLFTPAKLKEKKIQQEQHNAKEKLLNDSNVKTLIEELGAEIIDVQTLSSQSPSTEVH